MPMCRVCIWTYPWQSLCPPSFGPLKAFIRTHHAIHWPKVPVVKHELGTNITHFKRNSRRALGAALSTWYIGVALQRFEIYNLLCQPRSSIIYRQRRTRHLVLQEELSPRFSTCNMSAESFGCQVKAVTCNFEVITCKLKATFVFSKKAVSWYAFRHGNEITPVKFSNCRFSGIMPL